MTVRRVQAADPIALASLAIARRGDGRRLSPSARYVVRYDPSLAVWCIHHPASSYVLRIGPAYGRFSTPASALTHLHAFLTSPDAAKARLLDTPA